MATNQIKLKVVADADYTDIETLESKINHLKYQKIQTKLETDTAKLEEAQSEINEVKKQLSELEGKTDVDDSEVEELKTKLNNLENEAIDLEINVETDKLQKAQMEVDALKEDEVELQLRTQTAMEALDQVGQGFDRLKQGAREVATEMDTILQSAGKQELNKTFLERNIGNPEKSKQALDKINQIVADLPGDDTALQGLLSNALAKDQTLLENNGKLLKDMGVVATDYFSAMQYYGKSSIEAQQDMTNYILAGNTAELERSPILNSHIDKLKEATTVQERCKLLQEALNEEGWGGMSEEPTFLNTYETFNGMLERGRYNLGGLFLEGTRGAMEFALQLDEDTNGLLGMTLAVAQFATPLTDVFMGIGQIGMGLSTLNDGFSLLREKLNLGDKINALKNHFSDLKTKIHNVISSAKLRFDSLKTSIGNVATKLKTTFMGALTKVSTFIKTQMIPTLKNLGVSLLNAGRNALTAGANALRSAGMWVVQKTQLLASSIASGLATIKNWALAVSEWAVASPILIVIAVIVALIAVLGYLYFNNEQVRQGIDWLGQSFINVGQIMYNSIINAVNWIIGALQNLWIYITTLGGLLPQNVSITGNKIIDTILRVLLFVATLPLQIGMIFINIIAKVLGFGDNFVQNMIRAGSQAVTNFITYISQIPQKLGTELTNALNKVEEWASTLPQKFWEAGVDAVKNFLSALGIASPGTMQRMLVWEISEMARRTPIEAKSLLSNISAMGQDVVDEFGNPSLNVGVDDNTIANGGSSGGNPSNSVINIYLEVGSVDNEERVNEIIDVIKRELSWNNKTAGRSV